MVKIATWNVNSIKARLPNLLDWLKRAAPDVALLQEPKCVEENFPRLELEALGYHCAAVGQKSYNGVAIFSKESIGDLIGASFQITNPQATSSCGCGSSFSI
jgi:exodeoxyribonuclease-3